jgi:hypothetical protein
VVQVEKPSHHAVAVENSQEMSLGIFNAVLLSATFICTKLPYLEQIKIAPF